jgi:hypothetical protein
MDIIEGVSIISVGEARGHDMYVDMQTLREVKACAEEYKGGVKVNLNHGADIEGIVGYADNFRIVGEKLLADINLLKSSPHREYVYEISEKLPDAFGVSIEFAGPLREIDGKRFASCEELFAAAIVQTPAANATGLFSFQARASRVDKFSQQMEDAPKPELENGEDEISIADIVSRLVALETAFGDYKSKMQEPEMKPEEMCNCEAALAKDEETAMAAQFSALNSKLDTVIKTFGAAPMKGSAAAVGKSDEALDLKKVIEKKTSELGSRTAAIKFAMNNHPAEYIALRDSNQLNF